VHLNRAGPDFAAPFGGYKSGPATAAVTVPIRGRRRAELDIDEAFA
jgi:hypothetical protein